MRIWSERRMTASMGSRLVSGLVTSVRHTCWRRRYRLDPSGSIATTSSTRHCHSVATSSPVGGAKWANRYWTVISAPKPSRSDCSFNSTGDAGTPLRRGLFWSRQPCQVGPRDRVDPSRREAVLYVECELSRQEQILSFD